MSDIEITQPVPINLEIVQEPEINIDIQQSPENIVVISQVGTQGPQGPAGSTGPQGPIGPAGPNNVSTSTSTNITGILKGNGSLVSQAIAGTDYESPLGFTPVPNTRTVNTKPLSADVVLNTSDIADSLNKRYVTDANLTTIGNQSGVNTGDQDLSPLALKTTTISTTAPLTGGGDLSANRTLSIPASTALVDGYLTAANWSTFNGKQNALGFTPEDVANKDNGALSSSATTYPTSGAVKTVTDLKANIASPTFTGTVTAPALIIDALTGVLKATSGTVSSATAGTDYENPLTFSAPLSRLANAVSLPAATTLVNGYLTSTDWTTFNGKQNALGFTPANDTLSNLGSTAANNSINPGTNISHTLGASGLNWLSVATQSVLYDDIVNIDVQNRKLIDSATKNALDYENRHLLDKSAALVLDWDNCTIDKTRFGLTGVTFETVSKNLRQYDYALNYTSGVLTSIVYTVPTVGTITKTLNYTSGLLTSVVLSGSTPASIQLTKTLTYTSGVLTSIAYT